MESISVASSLRILRFLQGCRNASASEFDDPFKQRVMLSGSGGAKMLCQKDVLDTLHKASLIFVKDDRCSLTLLGQKRLKRADAIKDGEPDGGFSAQHQVRTKQNIKVGGVIQKVTQNQSESPLSRLKSRKRPDGQPWISDAEFQAGERLRGDFTKGQMLQNITMNWDPSSGHNKGAASNKKADISNSAVDARARIERALDSVGPELAGILTDVCCFLKGLELVECERRWPPRSAKLMLQTGLALLARHYGTVAGPGYRAGET